MSAEHSRHLSQAILTPEMSYRGREGVEKSAGRARARENAAEFELFTLCDWLAERSCC